MAIGITNPDTDADRDQDPYRDTALETCLSGGMYCPSASSSKYRPMAEFDGAIMSKIEERKNKRQDENIMVCPIPYRATIKIGQQYLSTLRQEYNGVLFTQGPVLPILRIV